MKYSLLTLLVLSFTLAKAQRYEKNFGGPGQEEARDLVELSDGSVVMVGTTESYGAGGKDMFVVKVSSGGVVQWTRNMGSTGDEEGMAITRGTADEIYVAGMVPQFGGSGSDIEVYRFNANGVLLNSMLLGGAQNDFVNDLAFRGSRLYIVGSTFSNGAQQEDIWLLKTDPSLNTTLNRNIGFAGNESANRICFTSDGNMLLAGRTGSFAGNTCLVVKANLQGDTIWTRSFDYDNRSGSNLSVVKGIAELSNQEIVISGPGWPNASFGQMFHAKLSSTGSLIYSKWSGQISDEGVDVMAGRNGDYYVLSNYCNFGCAIRLFRYDNAGTTLLNVPYQHGGGNSYPVFARPAAIYAGSNRRILISGTTFTTDSDGDMYLARLDSAGTVSVNITPAISVNGTLNICNGDSVGLTAPSGYLSYQWILSGTSGTVYAGNSQTLQAKASGIYRCYVTNSNGIYRSSLVTVTVTALPNTTITASGSLSFCAAAGQTLSLSVPSGTASWQWQLNGSPLSGATGNSFSPTQSGAYTVQVSNACTTLTSAVQVVNAARVPAPNLYCTDVNCQAGPFPCGIVPSGGLEVGNFGSGTTYSWFKDGVPFGNTTSSVAAWGLLPGIYTCQVSNACGSAVSAPYEVSGGTEITSNLKLGACNTQSAGILYAPVNSSPPYQWYFNGAPTGNGSSSLSVTQSGFYSLDYFAVPCNATESSPAVAVNLNSAPAVTVTASGSSSVCSGSIILNASTGGIVNATYNWYRGNTLLQSSSSPTYTATQSGDYWCKRWQTGCGFSTSNTLWINIGLPVSFSISTPDGSGSICSQSSGQIRVVQPISSLYTYQWFLNGSQISGANGTSYSPSQSGTYTCRATNACGSTTSAPFPVSYFTLPSPAISFNGDTTGCPGDPVVLQGPAGTGLIYQWRRNGSAVSGANARFFTVSSSGSYSLTLSAPGGCNITTNVPVNINVIGTPSVAITTQSYPMSCTGDLLYMNSIASNVTSYQWYRNGLPLIGQTASSYVSSQGGTYTLLGSNGCTSVFSLPLQYVVRSKPAASITASGPLSFCNGDSVTLSANTGNGLTYSWQRNGGQVAAAFSSSLLVKQAGFYKVTVTNNFGCVRQSAGVQVTVPCREGEPEAPSLNVWPNPNSGAFFVRPEGFDDEVVLEVFDVSGRMTVSQIQNSSDSVYEFSGLAKGMYVISARDSRNNLTQKIVVSD